MDRTPAQITLDEFTQTRLDRGEFLFYPAYMSTPLSRSLERLADLHDAPEGCCMDRQPHPRHIHQATAFAAPDANRTVLVRCPGIPDATKRFGDMTADEQHAAVMRAGALLSAELDGASIAA